MSFSRLRSRSGGGAKARQTRTHTVGLRVRTQCPPPVVVVYIELELTSIVCIYYVELGAASSARTLVRDNVSVSFSSSDIRPFRHPAYCSARALVSGCCSDRARDDSLPHALSNSTPQLSPPFSANSSPLFDFSSTAQTASIRRPTIQISGHKTHIALVRI